MKKVKLVVAYDGTNYCGWQIQPNGVTIEQKLNEALTQLLGEDIKVTGASRTDAGVHSLGNVCVFETSSRMPAEKISFALNQRLPEDIVVQSSCEVDESFHPRFSKSKKTYEYRILNRKMRMPTRRLDTYFFHYELDVAAMQKAAGYLVGEHDFKSFCAANAQSETTIRTIYSCEVSKKEDIITIRVTGNGFLYNMVRIIAGTLVEIGYHRRGEDAFLRAYDTLSRLELGVTAPPHGLELTRVDYPEAAFRFPETIRWHEEAD